MGKIKINGNLIVHGKLILNAGSKVYSSKYINTNAPIMGYTEEKLRDLPGKHIDGNLVIDGDNYYVTGQVLSIGAELHGGGTYLSFVGKEELEALYADEELFEAAKAYSDKHKMIDALPTEDYQPLCISSELMAAFINGAKYGAKRSKK